MTLTVSADRLDELLRDIADSELSAYDYFKLICWARWPSIDTCFPHLSSAFKLHCEGRMSDEMREWLNHRRIYPSLEDAVARLHQHALIPEYRRTH